MAAEPSFGARPEIVGKPSERNRSDGDAHPGRHSLSRERDGDPDKRKPISTEVRRERTCGKYEIGELTAPMNEPREVAAGCTVPERELDLSDREARPLDVDRHAQLTAEAARERKGCRASALAQEALPGERLPGLEAAAKPDQRASSLLRDPKASPDTLGEDADCQIVPLRQKWGEISLDVGVAEQQGPIGGQALGTVQRLALPQARTRRRPRRRPLEPPPPSRLASRRRRRRSSPQGSSRAGVQPAARSDRARHEPRSGSRKDDRP